MDTEPSLLVWPRWQRLLHWLLAGSVLLALLTFEGGPLHEGSGYTALAAALMRIALGLVGPPDARFKAFVNKPAKTLRYTVLWLRGQEPRHINHNPLGAWMVLALLVFTAIGATSGALYVTDRFWGFATVIAVHAACCWALLPLVLLHWAGVAHASWRHKENLVGAMWHGRKRSAAVENKSGSAR